MDVDNPIHDVPPIGGYEVGGLKVLAVATPTPSKNHITYSYL